MEFSFKTVDESNITIYRNLAQAYEAEFSALTHKVPDRNGLFGLDTLINYKDIIGYIKYHHSTPIGISAIRIGMNEYEVMEYYMIPSMRRRGHGLEFLRQIFLKHHGKWIIKQINGADTAREFWISTLEKLQIDYTEDHYEDPYWGTVTRQVFHVT